MKAMEGNAAHRPVRENPKRQPRVRLPRPPKALGRHGSWFWRVFGQELVERGVFEELDRPLFMILCDAYETYMIARQGAKDDGLVKLTTNGNPIQSPYVSIKNQAYRQLVDLGSRFGLSPADRARLGLRDKGLDEVEEWFFEPRT